MVDINQFCDLGFFLVFLFCGLSNVLVVEDFTQFEVLATNVRESFLRGVFQISFEFSKFFNDDVERLKTLEPF